MEKKAKTLQANKLTPSAFLWKYGTLLALFIVCIFFAVMKPAFATVDNLFTILRQIAMLVILSAGLTFVLITKRSDLSIGYGSSFLGVVVAALMVNYGVNMWVAVLVTILLGAVIGLVNGFLVAYIGVPDFIATLGVGFLVSGINQAYTKGHPISMLPAGFGIFGSAKILGFIPAGVIVMLIVLVVLYIILEHTRFGRYVYAIGGNEEATLMSGIDVKRNMMMAFGVSGVCMGVMAVVLTSRLGSAHPLAGESYLLDSIAAVYLGSTAFKNGEPNLAGTVVGALIIGVMNNGLTLMNVEYYYQDIAQGLIILLAVTLTSIQKVKKK